ncbi:MAG: NAD(P)/FAD-dependent oxidoreductase [Lachnospiraceae bacterium]|jgi:glycerol-3-phosphate dehydrogenase
MVYDVVIIGAGVTGCAVARELSRYKAQVCVLEKGEDVCVGTSKANSAIVHAGYDAMPGSLKARFNVEGNRLMDQYAEELDVPFRRIGSLVICTDAARIGGLRELYDRGTANGVPGMKLLSREETLAMEPNLSDNVQGSLYAPTAGIVCPFLLTIGLAENACENGVDFRMNTAVEYLRRDDQSGVWHIRTPNGEYQSRYIVNAAGVYADVIHNMASAKKIHITARRGEYYLLDKEMGGFVSHTIFPQPTRQSKGVLITPTVHGNLIVGPTAEDVDDKEAVNTTQEGLDDIVEKVSAMVRDLPVRRKTIRSFAGLRACEDSGDFVIGEAEDCPTLIDCAGIASPGLSSAPAIGRYAAGILRDRMRLEEKPDWNPVRKGILNPSKLSLEERNELIRKNPAYGTIVCRCESVTEGEIIDAIRRPLGARSLDGVKRRTRAGMGRCQAGFCSPRVMDILHRELGIPLEEITQSGGKSTIVLERTKGGNDR